MKIISSKTKAFLGSFIIFIVCILFLVFVSRSDKRTEYDESETCGIKDGIHSASLSYFDPKEGRKLYNVKVDVDVCEVIVINQEAIGIPTKVKIKPGELDKDGNVILEDVNGIKYELHVKQ